MQAPRRPRALVHVIIVVLTAVLFGVLSALAIGRGCGGGEMGWIVCLAFLLCALVSWTLFAVLSTVLRLCRVRPVISYATSTLASLVPVVVLAWELSK